MEEFLVFIKKFGVKADGKIAYQFYFSTTPETVWGDLWNVCPCSIVPDIKPDPASISSVYESDFEYELNLASTNSCFSMQDCIDDIISLGFFDINNEKTKENGKTIKFKFGDHLENVIDTIKKLGFFYYKTDFVPISEEDDDKMINDLIDKLGEQ